MDAVSDLQFRDQAVLLDDVLVIADLHVGRGAASNVELPVGDGSDMIERIRALCERFDPAEVVVAGDLLHSFQTVPRSVTGTVQGLQDVARDAGAQIVVTPGNHDTLLDAVWDGPVQPEYRLGETVVTHGHVEPEANAERYIVGHDHPTISIEGKRRPCYLAGEDGYEGAAVLMLPAFNRIVPGVEINGMSTGDFMSPLVTDLDSMAPIVWDDDAEEALRFPPLGEFRHRL